ncbi:MULTISPECIES: A24 family peptidase [Brevundimonas]|uniref:A24 family peptidase n=1 Tax=Brevundimonas TaxID=41275 RepID=UPI000F0377D4|nr:prepilin peptidase [Brevundimonas lutea]
MDTLILLCLSILPAVAIAAALKDLTTMTIPNWMSLVLIAAFFPTAWVVGIAPMSVLVHVGVAVVALFVGAGMFALRWIGGGDAKLLAAACLWMGLGGTLPFLLFTGMAGGVFCLALISARAQLPYAAGGPGWLSRLLTPKADIPYGVAIAIGALMAFPMSPLVETFASGV